MAQIVAQVVLIMLAALWVAAFLKARQHLKDQPEAAAVTGAPLDIATFMVLLPAVALVWVALSLG